MIRGVDVSLFGSSLVASGAVLAVGLKVRRRVLTGPFILLASLVAIGVARAASSGLPGQPPPMTRAQWIGGAVVAGLSIAGGEHLRGVGGPGWALLGLVLVALVSVWAGVPETSFAVVAGGVVVATSLVYAARPAPLSAGAVIAVSVLPALVGTLGASGIREAAIGSWLCVGSLMALTFLPPRRHPAPAAVARNLLLAGLAGAIAARHVAVGRGWDGSTWVATMSILGLASLSALALRAGGAPDEGTPLA